MDLEDRQTTAVALALGVFAVALPVIILAGSAFVMGWLYLLGHQNLHATIWGWLSTQTHDRHGHTVWQIRPLVWKYYFFIVTAYLLYQVGELMWASFRAFRKALT